MLKILCLKLAFFSKIIFVYRTNTREPQIRLTLCNLNILNRQQIILKKIKEALKCATAMLSTPNLKGYKQSLAISLVSYLFNYR